MPHRVVQDVFHQAGIFRYFDDASNLAGLPVDTSSVAVIAWGKYVSLLIDWPGSVADARFDAQIRRCRGIGTWERSMHTTLKSPNSTPALRPFDESSSHKKEGDEQLRLARLDDAAASYRRAVLSNPDYVDVWVGLGFVLSEQKKFGEADQYLRRALSIDPGNADAHYILGTISKNQNDPIGSIDHFHRALAIKVDFEFAYRDLFAALFQSGQFDEAKDVLGKAISVRPDSAVFHFYLGNLLSHQEDYDNAIACYLKALSIQPDSAESHHRLADALRKRGRFDEAVESYRKALLLEPDLVDAHVDLGNLILSQGKSGQAIASCECAVVLGSPRRATPSDTVSEKMAELLRPHADSEGDKWSILDLGCGTGLSGAAVASFARHVVGVDLSAKMLDKARERILYHRLAHLDLLTMMQGEVPSGYDVVFAADVFVYLGRLDELVAEAQRLLRPGGLFAFSVESLEVLADDAAAPSDGRDYQLNVTGRYAHSIAYLTRMAAHNGFEVLSTTATQRRLDKGKPVQGCLALWRRRVA